MEQSLVSFLSACETLNFRKTAELMNLSQPAITKQIKSLEETYGVKLFDYSNRKLQLTPQGEVMREYALSIYKCDQDLKSALKRQDKTRLRIGVTKTIGDYFISDAVARYLEDDTHEIEVIMDNTDILLSHLKHNRIDLAVIEGIVDKSDYHTMLIKNEPFVGICSSKHRFANKKISLADLHEESLILREEGSGTRHYLEQELENVGQSLKFFSRVNVISNFALLRHLVASDLGISFSYETVVDKDSNISTFLVKDFKTTHEFNAVYLNHINLSTEAKDFLAYFGGE